jgi:V/A-type H+/Na+-transporting ATPase subunit I
MFRPERMTSTSIICVKKDTEVVLETLNSFAEFHVEQASENQSTVDFDQNIQRVNEVLTIINEIRKHLITQKTALTDIFKTVKQTKLQVSSENWQALQETITLQISNLKGIFDEFNNSVSSLQEKGAYLDHLKRMLTTINEMDADLEAIEELKLIHITIASVPHKNFQHLQVSLAGIPAIIRRCSLSKDTDFLCFAMAARYQANIERALKTHHAEIFRIPSNLPRDISLALKEIENQQKENCKQENKISSELKKLGAENQLNLLAWKESMENILALLQAQKKMAQSGRLAILKGFVPRERFQSFSEKVQISLRGKALVLENKSLQDPPTKINHNRFVRPYEEITKLYGLPHYQELDPTPIIAITFPLIFGLMFGDIGHGLVLLIGGAIFGLLIKQGQSIKNICWILASCGAAAIFAGILFGEFFGKQLFTPLWFSPFDNVFLFLIFSLFVGFVQIMSGLVLEMTNFFLKHNPIDALLTSVPKIVFYSGAVYLLVVYQLNFSAWFSGPILLVIAPLIFLILGKPIFLAFSKPSQPVIERENGENSFGQRLFESGDLITRLLSNTMSYTRILALLMAHWALVLVVYVVAGLIGSGSVLTAILSSIIIVAGNVFVIALEGLIVFIHTMRLHFYEWFSKFYEGTGVEFTPFKQNFIYTEVSLKKNTA